MRFIITLILGSLAIVLLLFFAGIGNVVQALVGAKKDYLILALLMTILTLVIRSVRWGFYLKKAGYKTRFTTILHTLLAGCLIENITPARIGELFRPMILRSKEKVAISLTLPTVLVERVLDIIVPSLISLLGMFFLLSYLQPSILFIIIIGIVVMLILIGLILYLTRILALFIRLGMKSLRTLRIGSFEVMETELLKTTSMVGESVRDLLRKKDVIIFGLIFTFLIWFLNGARLYFVLESFGLSASLLLATVIVIFTILVATASMIPFGQGSAELTMVLILTSLSYPFELSTVVALVDKFIAVWFVTVIGAIAGLSLGISPRKLQ